MFHFVTSVDIHRPVGEVFEYLVHCKNVPEWVDTVVDAWQETEEPVGIGARLTEIVDFGLRRSEVVREVTAFERDRLCAWEADNKVGKTTVVYSFEAIGRGTRVTADVRSFWHGLLRLAQPIVSYTSRKQRNQYLAKAKEILETGRQVN
jgi:hypothetical protein